MNTNENRSMPHAIKRKEISLAANRCFTTLTILAPVFKVDYYVHFHYHPIGGTDSFLLNGANDTITQF